MSKRKTTPALPSMDDLLEGTVEESRSQSVSASRSRTKVTYYLPTDLVDRINDAHFTLGRMARGSDLKIRKYDMAKVAWRLALDDFEERGEKSTLVQMLLGSF
jgi:hypothetical protein